MAELPVKDRKIRLRVITPLHVVYDGMIDIAVARTSDGDLGVMYGHEPCSALLGDGVLRIIPDQRRKEQELLMVLGGILTVGENIAVVMSDIAQRPDQIEEYMDRLKKEKEENARREQTAEIEALRMERAIRQALVHVDINPYISIQQQEGERDR